MNRQSLLLYVGPILLLIAGCGDGTDKKKNHLGTLQEASPFPVQTSTSGTDGKDGAPGRDGYSVVFSITTGTLQCATGGTTVLMAYDGNRNMSLDAEDFGFQSMTICNGTSGKDGAKGDTGDSGQDGSDGSDGATGAQGATGERGDDGAKGETGQAGADGKDGATGKDGRDGSNGRDGRDAPPTSFTPVQIINPCGDASGVYDEVLLKLYSGEILASFSDNASGKNTRFSLIPAGSYMTTDGDNCYFTVTSNGVITNEHH